MDRFHSASSEVRLCDLPLTQRQGFQGCGPRFRRRFLTVSLECPPEAPVPALSWLAVGLFALSLYSLRRIKQIKQIVEI